MKIVFTADLHGNLLQLETLVRFAIEQDPDILLYGGDLFPKTSKIPQYNEYSREILTSPECQCAKTIPGQARVFKNALFPRFRTFLVKCPNARIFFCFGNADIWGFAPLLQEFLDDPSCVHPSVSSRFRLVMNETVSLDPVPLDLMTFSFIPFRFGSLIDWQRLDGGPLCEGEEFEAKLEKHRCWTSLSSDLLEDYGLEAVPGGPEKFGFPCVRIPPECRGGKFTLSSEIAKVLAKRDADVGTRKPTIVMAHCPPAETLNSVQVATNTEWGAYALRTDLLEKEDIVRSHKMFLYLCGHVHQSANWHQELTPSFYRTGVGSVVGGVPIVSAGNVPLSSDLSVIVLDLEFEEEGEVHVKSIVRHKMPAQKSNESSAIRDLAADDEMMMS